MNCLTSIIITVVLLCSCRLAAATPVFQSLSQIKQDQWLKLMHYKPRWFGGYKSLVDSNKFFFDSNGKYDPGSELESAVETFKQDHSVRCRFPARYKFLVRSGLIQENSFLCKEFLAWKRGVDAESVTLVFSTSFPNNPSSLFGHTFLRFNRNNKKSDLTDYGASYSAYVEPTSTGIEYVYKGLFGGFKGYFSLAPYYTKVNEYINSESRDLYEYELNIPRERVERIVDHLWELYLNSYLDYYFLDENCSYILAEYLEVGMPEWKLTDVNRLYYLPSDLIRKVISISKAVSKINYRPSLKKKLSAELARLDAPGMQQFGKVIGNSQKVSDVNSSIVLDAIIQYYNFKENELKGVLPEKDKRLFRESLIARSKIGATLSESKPVYEMYNRPDISHHPSKISLKNRLVEGDNYTSLKLKYGYQDLLSNDLGLERFSTFDFGGIALEYNASDSDLYIGEVDVIDILSLHPNTFYDRRISWQAGVGRKSIDDLDCRGCYNWSAAGGAGLAYELGRPEVMVYVIAGGFANVSENYKKGYRLGPKFEWSLIANLYQRYKVQFRQEIRTDLKRGWDDDYYLDNGLYNSFSLRKNLEFRLKMNWLSLRGDLERYRYILAVQLGYFF